MADPRRIYRLHIHLLEVNPAVWRRIEIRADATFWALHVAIQNAMGWTDSHLHDFELPDADSGEATWIGIPDFEEMDYRAILADYDERLDSWIHDAGEVFYYNYDYGDGWRHEVRVEAVEAAPPRVRYPRCLAGERACPPEDVGGTGGYQTFLEALANPDDEEHEHYRRWIGGEFDPEEFDPTKVRFQDPSQGFGLGRNGPLRLRQAAGTGALCVLVGRSVREDGDSEPERVAALSRRLQIGREYAAQSSTNDEKKLSSGGIM